MRKKIIVDFDGVMCDMTPKLCDIYNFRYNLNIQPEDITSWQLPDAMHRIYRETPDFFTDLPLREGAYNGIRYLDNKYDIYFATDPSNTPHIARDKMLWYQNNGLDHWPLIMTADKSILMGDLIIDDAPHHIDGFANTSRFGVLVDHPYNSTYRNSIYVKRATTWEDIIMKVGMLLENY